MPRVIEITITASVPEEEIGHAAVYLTRDPVEAVVTQLKEMGLGDAVGTRRLLTTKRVERTATTRPHVVPKPAA